MTLTTPMMRYTPRRYRASVEARAPRLRPAAARADADGMNVEAAAALQIQAMALVNARTTIERTQAQPLLRRRDAGAARRGHPRALHGRAGPAQLLSRRP